MSWREDIARWTASGSLVAYIDDLAQEVVAQEEEALGAAEMQRDDAAHSAEHWRESHDIERTRADAAEAEVARLRAENTRLAHLAGQAADLVVERNHYRERAETHRSRIDWMQSVAASAMRQGLAACRRLRADLARTEAEATRLRVEADRRSDLGQLLAEVDALRAIVEGRTVPPTDEEIMAHCRGVGAWVVTSPSWVQRVRGIASVRMLADDHRESEDATWRWIALDATGRPCAWPTVPRSEGP